MHEYKCLTRCPFQFPSFSHSLQVNNLHGYSNYNNFFELPIQIVARAKSLTKYGYFVFSKENSNIAFSFKIFQTFNFWLILQNGWKMGIFKILAPMKIWLVFGGTSLPTLRFACLPVCPSWQIDISDTAWCRTMVYNEARLILSPLDCLQNFA